MWVVMVVFMFMVMGMGMGMDMGMSMVTAMLVIVVMLIVTVMVMGAMAWPGIVYCASLYAVHRRLGRRRRPWTSTRRSRILTPVCSICMILFKRALCPVQHTSTTR